MERVAIEIVRYCIEPDYKSLDVISTGDHCVDTAHSMSLIFLPKYSCNALFCKCL